MEHGGRWPVDVLDGWANFCTGNGEPEMGMAGMGQFHVDPLWWLMWLQFIKVMHCLTGLWTSQI